MKPSTKIKRDLDRLVEFQNAYSRLVAASKRSDNWPRMPLVPKGDKKDWSALYESVALAAGPAQFAFMRQGGTSLSVQNGPVLQSMNPVANWSVSVEDTDTLSPLAILTALQAAIGSASAAFDDAQSRERGPVGLIAAFLRWPSTLREAVGPSPGQRRAAGAIGFVGQVLVATLSTALAAGVVALCVWLWTELAAPAFSPEPSSSQTPAS